MKCIYLTIRKGTRELTLIQYKGLYQIEDNQSDELNNVYFITYDKAKELFDKQTEQLIDKEEKQNDVEAQV